MLKKAHVGATIAVLLHLRAGLRIEFVISARKRDTSLACAGASQRPKDRLK